MFAGLFTIALWSSLAVLSAQLSQIPSFQLTGLTLSMGGLLSLPWHSEWQFKPAFIALGIYGLFGYHFFLFSSFKLAPIVEANVIQYLWPLLIVLLSPIIAHSQIGLRHILGGTFGFFGVVLMLMERLHDPSGMIWGYVLAFAAAMIWSSYSLLVKRVGRINSATVGLCCLISGLLALVLSLATEVPYNPNETEWLYLILAGFGPLGLSFYTWNIAIKQIEPKILGGLSYLTPLLSTLWLVLLTDDCLSAMQLLASCFIVGGSILSSMKIKTGEESWAHQLLRAIAKWRHQGTPP
ncbi:DMT family transporter [Pseudobacteriovorax antillogorgiicola]|uniref:Permease of the drug/metabolite transporter (DMT) superfamily n=1 Tax=Pseudobacteriovorax antillogorgiicola TaxID=1513793 RepID=A0A1Y6BFZ5_9BACT|nr:EamA family transporter [Pseudobacteriovorax antillogorgiicola]TCS56416.1 drug/metabolite transporter (DMT)-like permease [Pseudobacteriovorax antillogorgiicola]SMF05775.1 Permease of the drug/metabolite transporter (DMT) superfamily [Pseudobacteriovorax antillogorgiicola]